MSRTRPGGHATATHPTGTPAERAFLVALRPPDVPRAEAEDSLRELHALARTARAEVAGSRVFPVRTPNPATAVGKGQFEQLAADLAATGADVAVFDDDLTPAQARNLARGLQVRVVDRTQLILDIFAARARTLEGRLQIELAQLAYMRPRLRGLWTHLERQKGGIGLKGPGEKQLELDRRRLDQRLAVLRADLDDVRRRRAEQRRGRRRRGWSLVTLVGYTNAGKSTLLNRLASAAVTADSRLFATLDPTTRQLPHPNHSPCLLTDTVGFIRKLPHHLVEAFKATLEEVTAADLLLHVVDASQPLALAQCDAVERVLADLGALGKSRLVLLNKMDRAPSPALLQLLRERYPGALPVSAATGDGLDRLLAAIADSLHRHAPPATYRIPADAGRLLALLHAEGRIHARRLYGSWWHVTATLPPALLPRFAPYLK